MNAEVELFSDAEDENTSECRIYAGFRGAALFWRLAGDLNLQRIPGVRQ
jgi:hypothetical protein